MGRNRKKGGSAAIGAVTYDISGNAARPRRSGARPNEFSNSPNFQYNNENLPPGWEIRPDVTGRRPDLNRGAQFRAGEGIGIDPVTKQDRFITVTGQHIGNQFAVEIDGTTRYFPVEDVSYYVANPDAAEKDQVFDYGKLGWDVQQAIKAWDARREERANLRVSETESRDILRNILDGAFPVDDIPANLSRTTAQYVRQLRQANDSAYESMRDIREQAKRLTDTQLGDAVRQLDARARRLAQEIADLKFESNGALREQKQRMLYRRVAQTFEIAAQLDDERKQRMYIGGYDSTYNPDSAGPRGDRNTANGNLYPFGNYRGVAQSAYNRFGAAVQRALDDSRGKAPQPNVARALTTVPPLAIY